MAEAEIGVIGNGGEVNPLDESEAIELETPYGKPSAPIAVGEISGKAVAPAATEKATPIGSTARS